MRPLVGAASGVAVGEPGIIREDSKHSVICSPQPLFGANFPMKTKGCLLSTSEKCVRIMRKQITGTQHISNGGSLMGLGKV